VGVGGGVVRVGVETVEVRVGVRWRLFGMEVGGRVGRIDGPCRRSPSLEPVAPWRAARFKVDEGPGWNWMRSL
jgi:hypothetical protein